MSGKTLLDACDDPHCISELHHYFTCHINYQGQPITGFAECENAIDFCDELSTDTRVNLTTNPEKFKKNIKHFFEHHIPREDAIILASRYGVDIGVEATSVPITAPKPAPAPARMSASSADYKPPSPVASPVASPTPMVSPADAPETTKVGLAKSFVATAPAEATKTKAKRPVKASAEPEPEPAKGSKKSDDTDSDTDSKFNSRNISWLVTRCFYRYDEPDGFLHNGQVMHMTMCAAEADAVLDTKWPFRNLCKQHQKLKDAPSKIAYDKTEKSLVLKPKPTHPAK